MSGYAVVQDYPYPIEEVWEVLTSPTYVRRWTATGRGGRADGFVPVAGTRFRFLGRPTIGWDGVVHCEVIDVDPPRLLRYSWRNEEDAPGSTEVCYRLIETPSGTRVSWEHTGFVGPMGFAMSRLLGRVRRTMLAEGVPPVLADHHACQS
jgi:uncharacterized protein YndB with AHSA1/START domain